MITELYDRLTEALLQVGGGGVIKHVDLWNQNVAFIDEDEAWARPAVFVEFGPIAWDLYKGPQNGMNGRGELLLHIVTDWKGPAAAGSPSREESLMDYDLLNMILRQLNGLHGVTFRNLSILRTEINHNHEDILENIEVYKVTYERVL
ncbi:MAG: hypothetical protein II851_02480 [Bacteroidales bacterium]|nr:hypothetical protein [Bacteroidales bacterium]